MGTALTLTAIQAATTEAHRAFQGVTDGQNADYIPVLAKVDPSRFGIVVMLADGKAAEAGDTRSLFAIESISKVFTLARALDTVGADGVRQKIGDNPTGESFSSVHALVVHGGKPLNPFVNAGAIATVSLLAADSAAHRWEQILGTQRAFAGRDLEVMDEVYRSESATNQHNRALAWLLDSAHTLYSDPTEATDVYTRQCSVGITTWDLAVMGATLAAGGINPVTRQRAIRAEHVPRILAEMTMSGLYDNTGTWQYEVGLPGKSGVGGGILAVVPGRLAIATFSPPLDRFGNSVRGQLASRQLSAVLGLNLFAT
ncbi:glutaminase [Corallococcus sp. H22C18031201]|uniref:glutaminase A n=1 Tax=Citreicoccus inhibens TaxID=2849499 RepID=UPI000E75A89F|nr:glutaminase A [Citreicoccus inhibens]MBU8894852.1 glutaminase A [Citreicoccus inhibens]RJS17697.1 glutaminase [Corallococcus sp. H22C18031201]